MSIWKFEIIKDIPEKAESAHVFFHPALVKAWMETYTPLRNMEPITIKGVSSDNEVVMPLVLWRKNWKNAFIRTIIPVGYSDYDYHDPIFSHMPSESEVASFWPELVEYLNKEFKFDSIVLDGITDSMKSGDDWKQGEICPLLRLDDISNEEELFAFFKTSLRGDIRRQIRRLSELEELTYKEYKSWDEIPQATFAEFMRQHSARWPNAYKAPKFHENLLRYGLEAGVVHFSTLSVGETEIAWHLGFSYKGRYYYYMPAGNQEYFKYSPTKIHLFYLVRRAVENGYSVYDHLRGEENYKSGWSNDFQYVNSLIVKSDSSVTKFKEKLLQMRKSVLSH